MSHYDDVRSRLRGLVLNVPVPFKPGDFAVDYDGLRHNLQRWIAAGVPTLLLTYGTSEFYALSDAEIAEVTRVTCQTVNRRALVIAATGRWWLGQVVEFAKQCERWGADALMLTPMERVGWNSLADLETHVGYHRAVMDWTTIPLVYHSWYDNPRTIDAAEQVCELEHVVGLKQEFDAYPLYMEMGLRLGEKTALISGGGGALAYWASQWGFAAWLTGIGQWSPALELTASRAMEAKDLVAGRAWVDRITPFRRLAASMNNHAAIKHAMDHAGYTGGPLRPPARELSPGQKQQLSACIEADGLLP